MTSDDNFSFAVISGQWPKVLKMYQENRELRTETMQEIKGTALHFAVFWKEERVVESMVEIVCGKRINEEDKGSLVDENGDERNLVLGAQDASGNTPLHLAALNGSVKICEKISDADPSLISKRNRLEMTPLFLAALHGHKKTFLYLHDKYRGSHGVLPTNVADCMTGPNQYTVLHCAIGRNDIDFAIEILDHLKGKRINEEDKGSLVDENGDERNLVLGVQNVDGDTPLHLAALRGSVKLCEEISDADPLLISKRNKRGATPLFLAALHGHKKTFLYLHDKYRGSHGVLPTNVADCMTVPNQYTVLHWAIGRNDIDFAIQIVDHLKGKRINGEDSGSLVDENGDEKSLVLGAQDADGNTPLHLAASIRSVELCEKISDADPLLISKRNKDGETPLFLAALQGNKKAFLCLHYKYIGKHEGHEDFSTDVVHCIKRDNQDTILHLAIEEKNIDLAINIVLLYKDHLKEMVSIRNKNGLSPLHLLAETPSIFESTDLSNQSSIVRLLYHLPLRVGKKEAPKKDGLEQGEHKLCLLNLVQPFKDFLDEVLAASCWTWVQWIVHIILIPLYLLVLIPLVLPLMAENWFREMRDMKEKYTWSLQIMEELLRHASDEDMSANPYKENNVAGPTIVDTPLMTAAKNGVTEMVKKILAEFPNTINVVNEEGKNVVLLAAEKRQTKLYQILYQHEIVDESAFSQVDKDGNTALHLAAKPGVNLNCQTTTMVEEFKWFEFVKNSVPSELLGKYNYDGKTAEEIFRESYKEYITSDRQWLNQTSQTCSVASTLVASMTFSNIVADNFNRKNYSSILALSLSLTSTISFLAILAFRSQSLNFWRYVPFMLQLAILTMFGSIVALWISLIFNGKALTTYAILGSPIAILTLVSLPIFIGPTLMSMFTKVPPPICNATTAIRYRKPLKKEDVMVINRNQEPII